MEGRGAEGRGVDGRCGAAAAGRAASVFQGSQGWPHQVVATTERLLPRAVDGFLDEEPEGFGAELDRVRRDLGLLGEGWRGVGCVRVRVRRHARMRWGGFQPAAVRPVVGGAPASVLGANGVAG